MVLAGKSYPIPVPPNFFSQTAKYIQGQINLEDSLYMLKALQADTAWSEKCV